MTTLDIVKDKLSFLIKDYHFSFRFKNTSGNHYIFENMSGYIEFYEWEQFGEFGIYVKYDKIFKEIKLIEHYPKIFGKFKESHKGLKWIFKDTRFDFWEMISEIVRSEIDNKNNVFGLKI